MVDQTGFSQTEKEVCDSMESCMYCPFVIDDETVRCWLQDRIKSKKDKQRAR